MLHPGTWWVAMMEITFKRHVSEKHKVRVSLRWAGGRFMKYNYRKCDTQHCILTYQPFKHSWVEHGRKNNLNSTQLSYLRFPDFSLGWFKFWNNRKGVVHHYSLYDILKNNLASIHINIIHKKILIHIRVHVWHLDIVKENALFLRNFAITKYMHIGENFCFNL